jgi:hypothetical protein
LRGDKTNPFANAIEEIRECEKSLGIPAGSIDGNDFDGHVFILRQNFVSFAKMSLLARVIVLGKVELFSTGSARGYPAPVEASGAKAPVNAPGVIKRAQLREAPVDAVKARRAGDKIGQTVSKSSNAIDLAF